MVVCYIIIFISDICEGCVYLHTVYSNQQEMSAGMLQQYQLVYCSINLEDFKYFPPLRAAKAMNPLRFGATEGCQE